jgi:cytochrome b
MAINTASPNMTTPAPQASSSTAQPLLLEASNIHAQAFNTMVVLIVIISIAALAMFVYYKARRRSAIHNMDFEVGGSRQPVEIARFFVL